MNENVFKNDHAAAVGASLEKRDFVSICLSNSFSRFLM